MIQTLTSADIATSLQLPERTVKQLLKTGEIPAVYIKRQWRVIESDFSTYLKNKQLSNKKNKN